MQVEDLIIIGSGPAGLTAGIYAQRGGVEALILEGKEPGGQLMYTQSIENYPGFVSTGPGLVESMRKQAAEFGVRFASDHVEKLEYVDGEFVLHCKKDVRKARSVIVATGSNARWLGLPGEEKWRGHGISTCATCDGFAFRNQEVAVVGGGNTAVEDAIYLSKLAHKVTVIHRRDTLRAEKILQEQLFKCENVELKWNAQVSELIGDKVFEVVLLDTGEKLTVQGLFIAIGHIPNTSFLKGLLPLTSDGYVKCEFDVVGEREHDVRSVFTKIPGLFVAGDVMDPIDRQAITSAGYGCMAARRSVHFLNMLK